MADHLQQLLRTADGAEKDEVEVGGGLKILQDVVPQG